MSLETKIMDEIKLAMKSKNQARLRALRDIKNAILVAKTEKGAPKEFTEEQEVKLLQKLSKQRKDSIELFQQEGRTDLVEKEQDELSVIETFLPKMMDETAIEKAVKTIIVDVNAQSMKDMGLVMGRASKELAGKADMSLVSQIVREQLN